MSDTDNFNKFDLFVDRDLPIAYVLKSFYLTNEVLMFTAKTFY